MKHHITITIVNLTPEMEKTLEAILASRKISCWKTSENYPAFSSSESTMKDILGQLASRYKGVGILARRPKS